MFFKKRRKVLLVIDMQKIFVKEGTMHIVDSIKNIASKYHFGLVVQTLWLNDETSNFVKRLNYTKGIETSPSILDIETDEFISRVGYSAVTSTMESVLSKDDIIFVCGLETDACVLSTCMDLFSKGYNFYVLTDAIGSNDMEAHSIGIYLMQRNLGHSSFLSSSMIPTFK